MAEFEKPRRKRSGSNPDAGEDVYELADDDSPEPTGETVTPGLEEPGLLDALDEPAPRAAGSRPAEAVPGAAAPLPRIWKVAPDSDPGSRVPKRVEPTAPRAPKPEKTERKKPAAPSGGNLRREGAPIERVGQVKKPTEPASPPRSSARREARATHRSDREAAGSAQEPKVLVEATPSLDTYAARQAARVIFGVAMLGIFALTGLGIAWYFVNRSSTPDPDSLDAPVVTAPAPAPAS